MEEEEAMTKWGPQLPNVRSGNDQFNTTPRATGGNGDTYGSASGPGTSNNGGLSTSTSQKCLTNDAVVIAVPTKNVGEDDEDEAAGNGRGENAPLIDGYARKKRTSPELGMEYFHGRGTPPLKNEYFITGSHFIHRSKLNFVALPPFSQNSSVGD